MNTSDLKATSQRYAEVIDKRAIKTNSVAEARKALDSVRPGEVKTVKYGASYLTTRILPFGNEYSYECFVGLDERTLEEYNSKSEMMRRIDAILSSMYVLYGATTAN